MQQAQYLRGVGSGSHNEPCECRLHGQLLQARGYCCVSSWYCKTQYVAVIPRCVVREYVAMNTPGLIVCYSLLESVVSIILVGKNNSLEIETKIQVGTMAKSLSHFTSDGVYL